jgi:hypothetical protein
MLKLIAWMQWAAFHSPHIMSMGERVEPNPKPRHAPRVAGLLPGPRIISRGREGGNDDRPQGPTHQAPVSGC